MIRRWMLFVRLAFWVSVGLLMPMRMMLVIVSIVVVLAKMFNVIVNFRLRDRKMMMLN